MAIWEDKVAERNALHKEWLKTLDYLAIHGKTQEVRERAVIMASALLVANNQESADLKHKVRLAVKHFVLINK